MSGARYIIELTPAQLDEADACATRRWADCVAKHRTGKDGDMGRGEARRHFIGQRGEMAFCVWWRVPYVPRIKEPTKDEPDQYGYELKTSSSDAYDCLSSVRERFPIVHLQPLDREPQAIFKLVGWLYVSETLCAAYKQRAEKLIPAYRRSLLIPPADFHPMASFPLTRELEHELLNQGRWDDVTRARDAARTMRPWLP